MLALQSASIRSADHSAVHRENLVLYELRLNCTAISVFLLHGGHYVDANFWLLKR